MRGASTPVKLGLPAIKRWDGPACSAKHPPKYSVHSYSGNNAAHYVQLSHVTAIIDMHHWLLFFFFYPHLELSSGFAPCSSSDYVQLIQTRLGQLASPEGRVKHLL